MIDKFKTLDIPGWHPVLFKYDPELKSLVETSDETEAVRKEYWIISGDQYIYTVRSKMDPDYTWQNFRLGEHTYIKGYDEVDHESTIYNLEDLRPLIVAEYKDGRSINDIHPVLVNLFIVPIFQAS